MSNPARSARENNPVFSVVKSKHRHGITLQDASGKCCFESQVGQIYHYGPTLEEVNTAWVQAADSNYLEMTKADFNLRARKSFSAGDLLKWTDPLTGQYVILQPNNLSWVDHVTESQQFISSPAAVTGQPADDRIYWLDAYGSGRHWEYLAGTSRLSKHLIIDADPNDPSKPANLPAPTVSNPYLEIAFVMTPSGGVSLIVGGSAWDKKTKKNTVSAIEFRTSDGTTLWSFAAPVAFDSAEDQNEVAGVMQLRKQGGNYIVAVRIPYSFFQTATYPVYVDPTVNYQVGAGANDGRWHSSFLATGTVLYFGGDGANAHNVFFCFTGVTIPSGATIDASYLSFHCAGSPAGTPPECALYFEDAANPSAISSTSDGWGRTKTTATISITGSSSYGWWNSNSINTIIQELVNSYSYASGAAMQAIVNSLVSTNNHSWEDSFENAATYPAKLHIEYTEGGAGGAGVGLIGLGLCGNSPLVGQVLN